MHEHRKREEDPIWKDPSPPQDLQRRVYWDAFHRQFAEAVGILKDTPFRNLHTSTPDLELLHPGERRVKRRRPWKMGLREPDESIANERTKVGL